jgi:hypothetical protein
VVVHKTLTASAAKEAHCRYGFADKENGSYGNESMKSIVVLNKKLDTGVALNAASHMTAALVNKAPTDLREQMQSVDYHDKDGNPHPVSSLSLIVLRADNSNKVR